MASIFIGQNTLRFILLDKKCSKVPVESAAPFLNPGDVAVAFAVL